MGQFVQGGNFGCLMSFKKGEDDFPFFGSFLAHLEPELELFEVDDIGMMVMMICPTIIYQTPLDCTNANNSESVVS